MTSTDISEFVTLPRSEYDALKLRGNTYRKRALCLAQQAARFRQTTFDAFSIGELLLRVELQKARAQAEAMRYALEAHLQYHRVPRKKDPSCFCEFCNRDFAALDTLEVKS